MDNINKKKMNKIIKDIINEPLTIQKIDSILNIYEYIRKFRHSLSEKKYIFRLFKQNIINNNDLNGKIKILSYGIHGLVVYPSINTLNEFSIKIDNDNFVSKILDYDNEEYEYIEREINISKILRILDPDNNYFIYPLKYHNSLNLTNIIMKKGYPLKDYKKVLTEEHLIRFFLNILNSIEILKDNKILNLDIKSDNFILNKNDNNEFNLVMIDFSGELTINNKKNLKELIKNFRYYIHPYWPYEFNKLLFNQGEIFEKSKKCKELMDDYESTIDENIIKKFDIEIEQNMLFDMDYNYEKFYEKLMVYQIGKSFKYLSNSYFPNSKNKKFIKFNKILDCLINENYNERISIVNIKKLILTKNHNYKVKF